MATPDPVIGFVLGSRSDLAQLEGAEELLAELEVPYEIRILSAHRTPELASEYARTARERGLRAVVGVAGMAAHLAGTLAAYTDLPVLGVPARGGALKGFDALLSTVQMPAGVPVATFAIGKAGATNAALFACQILALTDPELRGRIAAFRKAMVERVARDDRDLRS